jgi:hypothetical protein
MLLQVKGTAWDSEETPASITPESVADDFWELYSKRDPDTWFCCSKIAEAEAALTDTWFVKRE